MHPYVNPANAVTASRFLTLPPFLYCVDNGWRDLAVLTVLVCGLLDKVDGAVAKLFDCKTDFGAFFDAIADGVCYAFFPLVLAYYGWVPWPPVVIIFMLGLANTIFRGIYVKRLGKPVNYQSFAMERVVAYAAYLGGFGAAGYMVDYFFYGAAVMMAIVVIHDGKRMLIDPVPA